MKCELCDKEATVFYTQADQSGQKKICLCDDCANSSGIMDPSAFSIADNFMKDIPEQTLPETSPSLEVCDHCGFTLDDYRKVGRLGCSHCYETFSNEILPLLVKMHRGVKHEGKIPSGLADSLALRKKLNSIRNELELAIKDENFEAAVQLRDQLKELEDQIG